MSRAFLRWCLVLAAMLMLVSLPFAASAQVYVAQFPPNPGVLPGGGWQYTQGTTFGDPPGPRAWTNGKYGGIPEFRATDQYRLPGPSGTLPVNVVSAAGMRGAALAVGRCVIGLNPVCAVGTAAYIAYKNYRAKPPDGSEVCGGVPCNFPSGQFDWDPGTPPVQPAPCYGYFSDSFTACTPTEVAEKYRAYVEAGQTPRTDGGSWIKPTILSYNPAGCVAAGTCSGFTIRSGGCNSAGTCSTSDNYRSLGRTTVTPPSSCPASIDALDPAYNIPAGGAVGPDGKCPTARYNHVPRTPEQLADLINSYPPNLPDAGWGKGVSDSIDLGGQQAPASLSGSGPTTQTGTPKTETKNNPDGTTGTTTTTPTTSYTYNNTTNTYPKITYSTVNNYTTQTCTGAGSCTTTGGGTTPGPTSTEPAQDPLDPCIKDPTRLSCIKVGEAGPKETIPTENVPATYTPTVFAAPGGCPAPIPFSVFGKSFSLGYEPMCNTLATIRLIFLAIGAVAAAWIFQEGFFKL